MLSRLAGILFTTLSIIFLLDAPIGHSKDGELRELKDATGVTVSLNSRPMRIITLLPSLGELAADIAGSEIDRIIGVSEFTDFPPALKKLKKVSSAQSIRIEEIIALQPDLILASEDANPQDQVRHLRELRLPVFVVATDSFSKIEESMRLVGAAMGDPTEGDRVARQFRLGLKKIQERVQKHTQKGPSSARPKTVLIEVSNSPFIVAGRRSFLHDAIDALGAKNIYGDLNASYPRPSVEDAVTRNPDIILILAFGASEPLMSRMKTEWARFPSMNAVKNQKIQILRDDSIARPTLRLLEGLDLMERAIYGSD